MNKNAIKKYATWARRELIRRVSAKASTYGISSEGFPNSVPEFANGHVLSNTEKRQLKDLINQVKISGYDHVIDTVAYTWFNRFCALRYMEVNRYLPIRYRIFSGNDGTFKPQILEDILDIGEGEIAGLDIEKLYKYVEKNKDEDLYRYLLITICNSLNNILPQIFQKIEDYTELLLPDNLLQKANVLGQMVSQIPEDDWKDQVQIIGWLYQYYNSERKDKVFSDLKDNVKISKENIPAATQLFTPDWIVRYMVENSLGRMWLEGHPDTTTDLKPNWKYYLDEAKQEPEVEKRLAEIKKKYATLNPEDIKCIDPCAGSGHILVYIFDVLVQIYKSKGYTPEAATKLILSKNLFGLDIDERAAQLAYFAVMMKARSYDKKFFDKNIHPHIYSIPESNNLSDKWWYDGTDTPPKQEKVIDNCDPLQELRECVNKKQQQQTEENKTSSTGSEADSGLKVQMAKLFLIMKNAKEYGSIINVPALDFTGLQDFAKKLAQDNNEKRTDLDLEKNQLRNQLPKLILLIKAAEILAQKYEVIVTNPPYMEKGNMNPLLSSFVKENYEDYRSDFFSAFIARCTEMATCYGKLGFFTPYVWMFIVSHKKLRQLICNKKTIETLIQFESAAFEEATVPVCSLTFGNYHVSKKASYVRLTSFKGGMEVQREKTLEAISNHNCGFYYETSQSNFSKIPGEPIAYWIGENFVKIFTEKSVRTYGFAGIGMRTGNNSRFLRFWYEPNFTDILLHCKNRSMQISSLAKWIPYNKGGAFKKWYGNNDYIVNWFNDGEEIKAYTKVTYPQLGDELGWKISNEDYYYKKGITWTGITSSIFNCRCYTEGFIFDSTANGLFAYTEINRYYLSGFLNTNVANLLIEILNPTVSTGPGTLNRVPIIMSGGIDKSIVVALVVICISLVKADWDSFETSWDFKQHPLVRLATTRIAESFSSWEKECDYRFNLLKSNEEELNKIFIDIYGLTGELTPEVEDKYISVSKADLTRDIKSFISYAVGCMFGRYSLDNCGLIYAGRKWDPSKYMNYKPDSDAIIPICDESYFDDDIVNRFEEFVEKVYGEKSLEENLQFIANAIGGNGSAKDIIRRYFLNEFFADHCKIYKKRPIYWLFDSGKKNSFKCLIYLHRYDKDTVARIRINYIHKLQSMYSNGISSLESRISATTNTSTGIRLKKNLKKLQDQADELRSYEEKIHHLADKQISIDLDDGVKVNYAKFQEVLAKIK